MARSRRGRGNALRSLGLETQIRKLLQEIANIAPKNSFTPLVGRRPADAKFGRW